MTPRRRTSVKSPQTPPDLPLLRPAVALARGGAPLALLWPPRLIPDANLPQHDGPGEDRQTTVPEPLPPPTAAGRARLRTAARTTVGPYDQLDGSGHSETDAR